MCSFQLEYPKDIELDIKMTSVLLEALLYFLLFLVSGGFILAMGVAIGVKRGLRTSRVFAEG